MHCFVSWSLILGGWSWIFGLRAWSWQLVLRPQNLEFSLRPLKFVEKKLETTTTLRKQQAQSWSISSFVHGEIKDKQTRQVQKMKISKCFWFSSSFLIKKVIKCSMNVNILIEDSGHLFRYKSEVTPVKKKSKVRHPAARLQFLQRSQFPTCAATPSLVTTYKNPSLHYSCQSLSWFRDACLGPIRAGEAGDCKHCRRANC